MVFGHLRCVTVSRLAAAIGWKGLAPSVLAPSSFQGGPLHLP